MTTRRSRTSKRAAGPRDLPRAVAPLAPFICIAWTDGSLAGDEIRALRKAATSFDDDARAALDDWLDPANPPDAAELEQLRHLIAEHADGAEDPGDLVELGKRIARAVGIDDPQLAQRMRPLQDALGVAPAEAARALATPPAPPGPARAPRPPFDPAALHDYIDADHADVRERVLELLCTDAFHYVDRRDTQAYREQVLQWCRLLAAEGLGALAYPQEFGGRGDVAASIAAFETIGYHDTSLLVKYGVQFGLFGGSIYLLGTRKHHERYLRDVATLALPGCFAMTESAHGSNVRDIETTAHYDADTGEFVIHTPNPDARKDYIGNAAAHGRMAVVFAQLHTAAGHHGVHAFLVPIRSDEGTVLPGIEIEDCGLKAGLDGVDNGRIAFDHVRIPRDNLLDRYASVSAAGAYTSPIPSDGRRFFTMLGTLVAGRISIACASVSAAKCGLTIAIRHTATRTQFGPEGAPEIPLLDYTTMQLRLLPRLATAFALDFAMKALVRRFAAHDADDARDIETLAAALKAYASDWNVATLQECREACGGAGFMATNRIGALRADTDVFTTFEGANHVLYQLVARGRLTEYRDQFGELRIWNIARFIAARAATRVAELNPIITRRTDDDHLLDPDFHNAALRYRVERLTASLARRLKARIDDGMDSFDALNECQDHAVALGRAAAEAYVLEQFQEGVSGSPAELADILGCLSALYTLSCIDRDAAWYLEAGYMEPAKSRAIRNKINELCRELRPVAVPLSEAFGVPDVLLEPGPTSVR